VSKIHNNELDLVVRHEALIWELTNDVAAKCHDVHLIGEDV
jgi:hypothetical protein